MADQPKKSLPSQKPGLKPAIVKAGPAIKSGPGDIKDLDLATGIDRIPEWWNRHGNKVLIVFTIAALAYALYSFRQNSEIKARVEGQQDLAVARETLTQLRNPRLGAQPPEAYAMIRKQGYSEASAALSDILNNHSDDESLAVQALLIQGDLNYTVAMLPDLEAATTRPTLKLDQTPEKLFSTARASYTTIVTNYPNRAEEVAHAKLGLAAIAENTGDFDTAKKLYTEVAGDAVATATYRNVASARLDMLPNLARPMRLRNSTTQPSSRPTTNP